jgi:hypothetical protein
MNTIKQYTVVADPETGEWLSKPQFVGYVIEKEWLEKKDTDLAHFDFFERSDLTGESLDFDPWPNSETCAIEERWTDYWWPSDGEVT